MKNRHFPHIIAFSTYKGGFDYEKNYLYYFNNCHKHFVRVPVSYTHLDVYKRQVVGIHLNCYQYLCT